MDRKDWVQDLYYREFIKVKFKPDEFYWEDGVMIMSEVYHNRRGRCCNKVGSIPVSDANCRHCPHKKE